MTRKIILTLAVLMCSQSAVAATFVVPTDEQIVAKANAIATGVVEGSYVQEVNGTIETVYEIRVERGLKGAVARDELLRVVAIGGVIGDRGLLAPGEAHYTQGERVLVFLTRDERGRWRTTDLTLGRFVFRTSTRGERLLVRDMEDVIGWDGAGRPHQEQVRREAGFLRFIEARVSGQPTADDDYMVSASEVTFESDETSLTAQAEASTYAAATYTSFVNNQPVRWPNMANGVPVYKRSDQNIAGASDGGVSVIQNALAAWTNECGSTINLSYAGQIAKTSLNHDATNVVEFNDPQGRISGSWSGSGTVAIAFLSFSGTHTFANGSWLNITDADVVFQDGYTASNASFPSAMTHELGHGLGWRHSNQNHATAGACDSSIEECTSAAVMNSSVSANYGYVLQAWDINAAQSVYPGGTCTTCTAPAISTQPTSTTLTAGQSATLSVSATGTATLTYQWYVGASGDTTQPLNGATGPSVTVTPSATTSYWARVTNSCGIANSTTGTVTVNAATCTAPAITSHPGDMTIPSGGTTTLSVAASGTSLTYQWYRAANGNPAAAVSGATAATFTVAPAVSTSYHVVVSNACGRATSRTVVVTVTGGSTAGSYSVRVMPVSRPEWRMVGSGDFTRDGLADILLQNSATGDMYLWAMRGGAVLSGNTYIGRTSSTAWEVRAIADFNRDGSPDILFQHATAGDVYIWTMNGTTLVNGNNFVARTSSAQWRVVAAADFNADGYADIMLQNQSTRLVAVWTMAGLTIASAENVLMTSSAGWMAYAAGDLDGNGYADVVLRNSTTGRNAIWLTAGLRVINAEVLLPTLADLNWRIVTLADFNADGARDVLWQNSTTRETAMWYLSGTSVLMP